MGNKEGADDMYRAKYRAALPVPKNQPSRDVRKLFERVRYPAYQPESWPDDVFENGRSPHYIQ